MTNHPVTDKRLIDYEKINSIIFPMGVLFYFL
jgi:hypothetical protein